MRYVRLLPLLIILDPMPAAAFADTPPPEAMEANWPGGPRFCFCIGKGADSGNGLLPRQSGLPLATGRSHRFYETRRIVRSDHDRFAITEA